MGFPRSLSSPFYVTLKQRVAHYFKTTHQDPKYNHWILLRYAFLVGVMVGTWYLQQVFWENWPLALAVAVVHGFVSALEAMHTMHDASHFCITHHPLVWRLGNSLHDILNGASHVVWAYQHVMGHHPYTNIDGSDPDIMTAAKDVPDIRRIKWQQTWFSRYFYQHVYVPLLYCVLPMKTRLQDLLLMYVLGHNGSIGMRTLTWDQALIFWFGKFVFVFRAVVYPIFIAKMPLTTCVRWIG